METTKESFESDDEFYIQTSRISSDNEDVTEGIGIFGLRMIGCDSYRAYNYFIEGAAAIEMGFREFKGRNREENYDAFKRFVLKLTKADPVLYDYDSQIPGGEFARALEQIIRNHIDRS